MLPLLFVLGLSAACLGEEMALFVLNADAVTAQPGHGSAQTRFKRQSTISYQVNHFAVQDQEPHEARGANPTVAPRPGYGGRGARQLSPKFPTTLLQTQQRAPTDYLDYGAQQYSSGPDALQQQYFGSLAQFAAEQQGGVPAEEPAQPQPPTTTLSPETQENIRAQQEYKDRHIKEQERLALGVRRPAPGPAPGGQAPAGPFDDGPNPTIQFVSAGGAPLIQPQQQFAQYDYAQDATGSDAQYYPAPAPAPGPGRPLFTSAENSGKSTFTKRLVPKNFQPGKSLLDPTQSFSYTQLQFGDNSPNEKYYSKLHDLRQKLVPQAEQHVAQRSAPKQRPKYEPTYVYDTAAYQIESSTPNSLPHYVASTPKAHYVSQYYHPTATARPSLVYTQSSGDSGLVHPKAESSTAKPVLRPQYIATTPEYYYESTPAPQYETPKHQKKLQKLIAPDFVTAAGEQQLRQLQRLQQLQQAQQQQNYEAQGIEFDQDLQLYSQPTKGFYANIKKAAVHTPSPSPAYATASPAYATAPSKSAYFVSTAAPHTVRESNQEDYGNNELSELSVQTPDGRKPLTPAEIKALVSAGFHIPELKHQDPSVAVQPVRRPVYSYQPVQGHPTRAPVTETPDYVTRVSPTYTPTYTPVYSTASPYDDVDSNQRATEQRYRSTVSHLTGRKRVTVAATPAPLSAEEEKLGLPRDGVRHYYRVDASDSGTAPQAYVLVGGHVRAPVQGPARGLGQYSSLLVSRSADQGKKTEKAP
nr:PREDICTED: uncharacterized protein LOC109039533 isoform X2 [Bemisia tabaci]